ncbi:MAG: glycosyltransferase family 2 protein [Gammaproteobacteria bacterium]|nr:glycosyltransferase family 2 protein [Gammaproteobacteria bacterium]
MDKIAVVVPVYGCPESLEELCLRLVENLKKITNSYEILLVDDCCPKGSWQVIERICSSEPSVKGIKFSRNFGQHYAILAGMRNTDADYVIIMDCDLQDPPEEIPSLYAKVKEGYEKILVKRISRKHSILEKVTSYLFYRFLSYMTGTQQDSSVGNFGIYSKKVVAAMSGLTERSRLLPVHSRWVGFSSEYLEIAHNERHSGSSSYTFHKRIALAVDIILSFSDRPLWMVIKAGFTISLISFFYAAYIFFNWLFGEIKVDGWTSLIISVWLLAGVILATLGFVGVYVAKTFDETKNRPLFIIDEQINVEN